MKYDQFMAQVRDRGEYPSQREADRISRVVLGLLGQRLAGGESSHLASQLPRELQDAVSGAEGPEQKPFSPRQFVHRLAEQLDTSDDAARWDASAVLTTVADAVSGGQLNQVLTQLPSGYAELFGKSDLV